MEFRILGPVELWDGGRCDGLGTPKERCVLAVLLDAPGRPVSAERLIDAVWDGEPPTSARDVIYTYVSRWRSRFQRIGGAHITSSRSGGYALETDPESIDLERFRLLRSQARAMADSGEDDRAVELYRDATTLWRGEPLADLPSNWAERTRKKIERELIVGMFERMELELRLGHHADLIGELYELEERHPFEEKIVEYLVLALYRCGRKAEALQVVHAAVHRIREELGVEVGPEVRELHVRILNGDRGLLNVREGRPVDGPHQHALPPDLRSFTGRGEEVGDLLAALEPPDGPAGDDHPVPSVVALDGMAGVGKTVFAIHVAHLLADRYPDGQLFLDLDAHDAQRPPMEAAAALDLLLREIGVPPSRIPGTLDGRSALWQAKLARHRFLLVLDNAAGHGQIRPLLPSVPGSLALVTSRRRLVGLDDVLSRSLDVLPSEDAARLFRAVVGPGHAMADPDVAEVVRLCDRLPLAIQLVGNRLRHRPAWSVTDLIDRLARTGRRLMEIRAENREITAAFELSYQGLTERQRRAFRRLGLHPGQSFARDTALAVIGGDTIEAERTLDDLVEHHLVTELHHDRFRLHDLLRDYARELAGRADTEDERRETLRRMLDHYLDTADRADRLLGPARVRVRPPPRPEPVPVPLTTAEQARAWLRSEQENLLACTDLDTEYAALLAGALAEYLEKSGLWEEAARLHDRAAACWLDRGDRPRTAQALCDLSQIRFRSGRYADALTAGREALTIYRSAADRRGEADVLDRIGLIRWQQSRYGDALAAGRKSLAIRRSLGDRRGEAQSLDHNAIFLDHIGRYREATEVRAQALDIYRAIGDTYGQQLALNNMGHLQLRLGRVAAASDHYERAAAIAPEMSRQHQAIWRNNMAEIHRNTGRFEEALDGYRAALRTYREIGDRRSEIETIIGIGLTFQRMERYGEALIHHQKALAIAREITERYEEVRALRHVAEVLAKSGRYALAHDHYEQALGLAQAIGDPLERAKVLEGSGTVLLHTRGRAEARKRWKQALRLFDKLGLPDARIVRTYLDMLDDAIGS